MNTAAAMVAILLIGLVVGSGVVYLTKPNGGVTTVAATVIVTSTLTASAPGGVSANDFKAALNNTVAPDLVVTSYSFGKGTLTVWVLNNGTEPFVITAHVPLLNGSTDSIASVISLDSSVVHVGSYLYVPPGGTLIVSVDAGSYLPGQKGVLTIYGDSWTFVYGTQKD